MPKLHNFGEKTDPSGTLQAAGLEGRDAWPQRLTALIVLSLKLAWKTASVFPQEGKQSHLQDHCRCSLSLNLTQSVLKGV